MDVTKVRFNQKEGRTVVEYRRLGKQGLDEHTLTTKDMPDDEFVAAWGQLAEVAAKMLGGKNEDYDVRALHLSEAPVGDEKRPAAQIGLLKTLPWTATPLQATTPLSALSAMPHKDAEVIIERVVTAAAAFVRGKRAQGDLFGGAAVDTSAETDAEFDDGGVGLARVASGDGAAVEPELA